MYSENNHSHPLYHHSFYLHHCSCLLTDFHTVFLQSFLPEQSFKSLKNGSNHVMFLLKILLYFSNSLKVNSYFPQGLKCPPAGTSLLYCYCFHPCWLCSDHTTLLGALQTLRQTSAPLVCCSSLCLEPFLPGRFAILLPLKIFFFFQWSLPCSI